MNMDVYIHVTAAFTPLYAGVYAGIQHS